MLRRRGHGRVASLGAQEAKSQESRRAAQVRRTIVPIFVRFLVVSQS